MAKITSPIYEMRSNQAADYLVQHAQILAWRLSHEGFQCFVPKDMTAVSTERDGMVYDA